MNPDETQSDFNCHHTLNILQPPNPCLQTVRVQARLHLIGPGRGQPMSLGPLGWSFMSSDGLVHPRKIVQVYLTCPHSH